MFWIGFVMLMAGCILNIVTLILLAKVMRLNESTDENLADTERMLGEITEVRNKAEELLA